LPDSELTVIDEPNSQERLADASRELTTAQTLFQRLNHELKRFDSDHSGELTNEEAAERESLLALRQEALSDLKDKEAVQRFAHHESYAMSQGWGRSSGKFFRGDKKFENRG
jgi:hypothetical protein